MRKIALSLIFVLSFLFVFSQNSDLQCYTIVAGKSVTTTGHVIAAHNEDDYGDLIVNIYRTPAGFFTEAYKQFVEADPAFNHKPLSTLWFEVTNQNFGDALINEKGVAIWSDACPSKEDTAQGLLTYQLRRIVAEYARTAREGAKLIGHLVEKYGYNSSGRTYCVADADEAWLVAVVKGRHWVARRVPDDAVAFIPNYYTIEEVDLNDTNNFLGSKDIVSYAIKRGWFNPEREKTFNFRQAYSAPMALIADWNIPRHWGGVNLISKDTFWINSPIPFAIKPESKVSAKDLMNILSYHYENTLLQPDQKKTKNPHQGNPARICNAGTKISLIAQFNSNSAGDQQNLLYFAPLNPCIQAYIPISMTIQKIPRQYQNRPISQALDKHFDKKANLFEQNPWHAYSVFEAYNNQINDQYWTVLDQKNQFKSQQQTKLLKDWLQATDKNRASFRNLFKYYKAVQQKVKKSKHQIVPY